MKTKLKSRIEKHEEEVGEIEGNLDRLGRLDDKLKKQEKKREKGNEEMRELVGRIDAHNTAVKYGEEVLGGREDGNFQEFSDFFQTEWGPAKLRFFDCDSRFPSIILLDILFPEMSNSFSFTFKEIGKGLRDLGFNGEFYENNDAEKVLERDIKEPRDTFQKNLKTVRENRESKKEKMRDIIKKERDCMGDMENTVQSYRDLTTNTYYKLKEICVDLGNTHLFLMDEIRQTEEELESVREDVKENSTYTKEIKEIENKLKDYDRELIDAVREVKDKRETVAPYDLSRKKCKSPEDHIIRKNVGSDHPKREIEEMGKLLDRKEDLKDERESEVESAERVDSLNENLTYLKRKAQETGQYLDYLDEMSPAVDRHFLETAGFEMYRDLISDLRVKSERIEESI